MSQCSSEKVTAKHLVNLLEKRHADDLTVPECKNGPTHQRPDGAPRLRMDFWAMSRSWTQPWTYGYEIKVSRSDFLSDDKWPGYLRYCNRFAFVCPRGVIQPDELPPEAGLIYCTKNGTGLLAKKKPPHRDVEIPEQLWRYILMCRAEIKQEHASDRAYWERWLEHRRIDQFFGEKVSKAIRQEVDEKIRAVQRENVELSNKARVAERVYEILDALGVDRDTPSYRIEEAVRDALVEKGGAMDMPTRRAMKQVVDAANRLAEHMGERV